MEIRDSRRFCSALAFIHFAGLVVRGAFQSTYSRDVLIRGSRLIKLTLTGARESFASSGSGCRLRRDVWPLSGADYP
jgi:hypothetical protein